MLWTPGTPAFRHVDTGFAAAPPTEGPACRVACTSSPGRASASGLLRQLPRRGHALFAASAQLRNVVLDLKIVNGGTEPAMLLGRSMSVCAHGPVARWPLALHMPSPRDADT